MSTSLCCAASDGKHAVRCYSDGEVLVFPRIHSKQVLSLKHSDIPIACAFAATLTSTFLFVAFRRGRIFVFSFDNSENQDISIPTTVLDAADLTSMSVIFSPQHDCFLCFLSCYSGHIIQLKCSITHNFSHEFSNLTFNSRLPDLGVITALSSFIHESEIYLTLSNSFKNIILFNLNNLKHSEVNLEKLPLTLQVITSNQPLKKPLLLVSCQSSLECYFIEPSTLLMSKHTTLSTTDSYLKMQALSEVSSIVDLLPVLGASISGKLHLISIPTNRFFSSTTSKDLPASHAVCLSNEQLPSFPVGICVDQNLRVYVYDSQNYSIVYDNLKSDIKSLGTVSIDQVLSE
ncbi:hypothetical protein RCL1_000595 [Eukaryota sp. TZLM3-RCL]